MNRIVRSLQNMAEFDSRSHESEAMFSVYILDVIPLVENCSYDFYVGSTWKPVEERYQEHKQKGDKSARIFRSKADVGEIRWDLMEGFPKFHTRAAVERAEGRVAKWLVNKGFQVRCNALEAE
jgi:hypothetical protein